VSGRLHEEREGTYSNIIDGRVGGNVFGNAGVGAGEDSSLDGFSHVSLQAWTEEVRSQEA
jgi:hypothetical protein